MARRPGVEIRFGIGEWFGKSFTLLTDSQRKKFCDTRASTMDCPFRSTRGEGQTCNKNSGVCSLRLYQANRDTGQVTPVQGPEGMLRTTCPSRFLEDDKVFRWIGEELLGQGELTLLNEVPYLEPVVTEASEVFAHASEEQFEIETQSSKGEAQSDKSVGSVDFVLARNDDLSAWCAVELQSVYFSGAAMSRDFKAIKAAASEGIPFPAGRRRPDYRSSGPKRLMPQLQIKVPSLRRWGKKTAVVVDKWFWASLGKMGKVEHISNCDIAWFVVEYREEPVGFCLQPYKVFYTTLEAAIEGLTAGRPVSLPDFEAQLRGEMTEDKKPKTRRGKNRKPVSIKPR